MKKYLHLGWPAGKLAQYVNISPSRLHQLFKDELGLPPAKYLHHLRMKQARELLETSYLSVKEVMRQIGVTDESHFVRDFKKSYGLTPAKYRQRFLKDQHVKDLSGEHSSLSSAAETAISYSSLEQVFLAPAPASSLTSPLLLRRASHPRHLAEERDPFRHTKKKREILSLLYLRHAAFARLTTFITDKLARERPGLRSILIRPRPHGVSRKKPPRDSQRQRLLPPPQPSTVTPSVSPSNFRRPRRAWRACDARA